MLKYNTQELFQRHQSASTPEVLQRTVVCLHNIRSSYNVGAVFRNADAFGIREIYLSGFTPTPPSSEISKTAIGAESNVNWKAFKKWEDCYRMLRKESAYLVGLLPSPNGYNVCTAPQPGEVRSQREERERERGITIKPYPDEITWTPVLRRNLVLKRMLAEGFINGKEYKNAIRHPLKVDLSACRSSSYKSYPFFANYALQEMAGPRYSLNLSKKREGGNYYAVATVDPTLQRLAEIKVKRFLETDAEPIGVTQAALISLDFETGDILAYVGGKKYGYRTERGETSQPGQHRDRKQRPLNPVVVI